MNNIDICIHSGKNYSLHSKFTKKGGVFLVNILLYLQYGKLQKAFDILSTIFRLVGNSILYSIFEYIWIFEYIHEYFFMNNILIHICDTKCQEYSSYSCSQKLWIIFVFVFFYQNFILLHSDLSKVSIPM